MDSTQKGNNSNEQAKYCLDETDISISDAHIDFKDKLRHIKILKVYLSKTTIGIGQHQTRNGYM